MSAKAQKKATRERETCLFENCNRPEHSRGCCRSHYTTVRQKIRLACIGKKDPKEAEALIDADLVRRGILKPKNESMRGSQIDETLGDLNELVKSLPDSKK